MANNNGSGKPIESWIWDAAPSIRGAKDAPKYKDYILPVIFTKRLCNLFDGEINRIVAEVGSRARTLWKIVEQPGAQPQIVRTNADVISNPFNPVVNDSLTVQISQEGGSAV